MSACALTPVQCALKKTCRLAKSAGFSKNDREASGLALDVPETLRLSRMQGSASVCIATLKIT
jgi:hypothetical protein